MSDQVSARRPGLRAEPRPSYRPEKKTGFDPDLRRIGLLAVACAGGMAAAVGLVSLISHRSHGIPVIEADAGPVRVKPADPGGEKFTGVEQLRNVDPNSQTLAPAPEQPAIDALREQMETMRRQLAREAAATAEARKLATEAKQQASARIVVSPAPLQAAAISRIPPILQAPVHPVSASASAPVSTAPGVSVQLAALTDEAAAHAAWKSLSQKLPDLLGSRAPEISRVSVGGRTMWRLRTGPFPSVADATGFCAKLRGRDTDCSIAAF